MKKLLLLIILCCLKPNVVSATPCDQDDLLISDQIMVRMADGVSFNTFVKAFHFAHPNIHLQQLDQVPNRPIFLASIDVQEEEIDAISTEIENGFGGLLTWGEFVYENEGPEGTTGSIFVDRPISTASFRTQYSSNILGIEVSHDSTTGLGVVVAVLDTGIVESHPVLLGKTVLGGYDFIDGDNNPTEVQDGVDNDVDGIFDEGWGHGTFVASIVLLVAPDAKILPIRVLDSDNNGTTWSLAKGMFHAIDRGVEVINISIGSTYHSDAIDDAVDEAKDVGIVIVAAAGNCGREEPRTFPAMQSNVIGVVATDIGDSVADFSNYGELIAIAAPGFSKDFNSEPLEGESIIGAIPDGGFAYWQGTSMASPLVSGAVALVRSQHPELPADSNLWGTLTNTLLETAQNIDAENPNFIGLLGSGRMDVAALVFAGPIAPALGDLNGDGVINVSDILQVISSWGQVHSSADFNGDGIVNVLDLLILIDNWN